ncbi:hypothetical protein BA190_26740 [Labrys sp. WJW]|uniref:hypothetical protein n=1 Tax=Labrys sp. WJW TaxID=1737983 RepID=UPI0008345EA9|nr:hypothetical protein [Labrys sp. WJW]OCC01813.1 hypothetical protein BA190_26740 [Labrys sp. WJW]
MAESPKVAIRISIPHVSWRDGRPRFNPGPKLRRLGYKGEDLRHGKTGAWFTQEETLAWVSARVGEIEQRRRDKAAGKRLKPMQGRRVYSVEDLFKDWFASPRLKGEAVVDGKRNEKGLSSATIKDYGYKRDALQRQDGELFVSPVAALTGPICYGLYEDLWRDTGLSTARGVLATLSAAISWGMKRGKVGFVANPCKGLGLQTPPPRVRALTPAEVDHLVKAADSMGRPEIGDSVLLGVWTGQRQADRLQLIDLGLIDGRRVFRQSKTKAIVEIPEAPALAARLAAARARREEWKVKPLHTLVDERTREPWKPDWYRHVFAEVRNAAVDGVRAQDGSWLVEPMPALDSSDTGLPRDQDLRDTAVTWLARAGCTVPQICAITGHSEASVYAILKHYLSHHRELADQAIAKVISWHDGQVEGESKK